MVTKDLTGNVPLYPQEQCDWCGAATVQMTRNGYPNPRDRMFFWQFYVWNMIQGRNSTNPNDVGWATDPQGLLHCVRDLRNPTNVSWQQYAGTDRYGVLFSALDWMNRTDFPCPVLINQGQHWVTAVGFSTDIPPTPGGTPNLETITYNDPLVGYTQVAGSVWFDKRWNGGVMYDGTWRGQYVVVLGSGARAGRLRARRPPQRRARVLTLGEAGAHADHWVRHGRLADSARFSIINHKRARALPALLVNARALSRGRAYYIVPIGLANEFSDRGTPLIRASLLINAFTGAFEEMTVFTRPMSYLSKTEALAVAAGAWPSGARIRRTGATVQYQASAITQTPALPFWRVKVNNRFVYVDQTGTLHGQIRPSTPGN
jgi:hypothetical protein